MDKHIPKVYSALNNMHPGPVPSELLVSITLLNILINKFYYALCYITFDITVLHLLFGIGIITSRRNVNLTHHSHDVSVLITSLRWPWRSHQALIVKRLYLCTYDYVINICIGAYSNYCLTPSILVLPKVLPHVYNGRAFSLAFSKGFGGT